MFGIAKTSLVLSALIGAQAFVPSTTFNAIKVQQSLKTCSINTGTAPGTSLSSEATDTIVSPFDNDETNPDAAETFELTWDNVELVLDGMRPYLIQDGGNVSIAEIDGPIVRLQLEGACGTCPSSTQTMKMGLERGLMEKIPEIQEVIQAMPDGPALDKEGVETILDGVRPFLKVAGGTIVCESITGEGSSQPSINLRMAGSSASLNSVKLEISQRLQRYFMLAGLQVEFL
jgi:lysyl-tRNA synthetase class 2